MKRILIIDDVRDRAAWLKASLELAGFDVVGLLAWEQVDDRWTKVEVPGDAPNEAHLALQERARKRAEVGMR